MANKTANPDSESLLQDRDYTIIFARTAPIAKAPPPGFERRWLDAQASIINLLKYCETFDPDGITLYVACHDAEQDCAFKWYEHVTSDSLDTLIAENLPPKQINLHEVLRSALDDYFARKDQGRTKGNGEILLVLLDGEPADRMAIARVIVEATHKIDRNEELGIGLVQIGDDPIARGFFAALDDNLQAAGAKFDIVDTCILDRIPPDSLTEFLLNTLFD
ncbi:MAG: hypothetical protein VKK04_04565 [Synechococcales bacterium]|nr:hypothetical protein [Synechococcales bacterium]